MIALQSDQQAESALVVPSIVKVWVEWRRERDTYPTHLCRSVEALLAQGYTPLQAGAEAHRLHGYEWGDWHYEQIVARALVRHSAGVGDWKIASIRFASSGSDPMESDAGETVRRQLEQEQLAELEETLKWFGVDVRDYWEKIDMPGRIHLTPA